jgi:GNAT superfamily N-acetyltransferase
MPGGDVVLTVRPFREGDRDALQAVRREAFRPIFASFRHLLGEELSRLVLSSAEAEQARLLDRLCQTDASTSMLVGIEGGVVVGFVGFTLDRATGVGEVSLNAVLPAHAGRGIGTRLHEAALDRMRTAGMKAATVSTGGDVAHAPARRAYAKAGFGEAVPSVTLYRRL